MSYRLWRSDWRMNCFTPNAEIGQVACGNDLSLRKRSFVTMSWSIPHGTWMTMFSALLRGMMEELPIRTQQLELIKLRFNLPQELLWLTMQPLLDAVTPRVWVIILKSRRA